MSTHLRFHLWSKASMDQSALLSW
uniref:Uncharacterized protein n=1 Tax=Anguilla anguilla TaxID=7936 RepID=A0A0E9QLW9_ANGAN